MNESGEKLKARKIFEGKKINKIHNLCCGDFCQHFSRIFYYFGKQKLV